MEEGAEVTLPETADVLRGRHDMLIGLEIEDDVCLLGEPFCRGLGRDLRC